MAKKRAAQETEEQAPEQPTPAERLRDAKAAASAAVGERSRPAARRRKEIRDDVADRLAGKGAYAPPPRYRESIAEELEQNLAVAEAFEKSGDHEQAALHYDNAAALAEQVKGAPPRPPEPKPEPAPEPEPLSGAGQKLTGNRPV